MAFETIHRDREKLIAFLQKSPDLVLDDAAGQRLITEEEYDALFRLMNPKEKMQKLLIEMQNKGEQHCQKFLNCITSRFQDLILDLWPPASGSDPNEGSCDLNQANVLEKEGPENPGSDPNEGSCDLNQSNVLEKEGPENPGSDPNEGSCDLNQANVLEKEGPENPGSDPNEGSCDLNQSNVLEKEGPENPGSDPNEGSCDLNQANVLEKEGPENPGSDPNEGSCDLNQANVLEKEGPENPGSDPNEGSCDLNQANVLEKEGPENPGSDPNEGSCDLNQANVLEKEGPENPGSDPNEGSCDLNQANVLEKEGPENPGSDPNEGSCDLNQANVLEKEGPENPGSDPNEGSCDLNQANVLEKEGPENPGSDPNEGSCDLNQANVLEKEGPENPGSDPNEGSCDLNQANVLEKEGPENPGSDPNEGSCDLNQANVLEKEGPENPGSDPNEGSCDLNQANVLEKEGPENPGSDPNEGSCDLNQANVLEKEGPENPGSDPNEGSCDLNQANVLEKEGPENPGSDPNEGSCDLNQANVLEKEGPENPGSDPNEGSCDLNQANVLEKEGPENPDPDPNEGSCDLNQANVLEKEGPENPDPDPNQGSCDLNQANVLEKEGPENPDLLLETDAGSHKAQPPCTLQKMQGGRAQMQRRVTSFLMKLGLNKRNSKKLTMAEVLEINSEALKTIAPETVQDLPWYFLRKLMTLNGTARNTDLENKAEEVSCGDEEIEVGTEVFSQREVDSAISVNPLDVLCAILLCSDSFLQQEILLKMSMCQFALPLILPPLDAPKCTFMLWGMRDIVKKWRSHSLAESRGFQEESIVLTSMLTISFVRVGNCSLSKSKLINEVLSPPQQHHDLFVHRDMECGNVLREISDGLVEISWYFPGGRENSDLFPEPVAVLNLRGDIESHWTQFSFLTEVSSAVFIITESICDKEYQLLLNLQKSASKCYFIWNAEGVKSNETRGFLDLLAPVLNMKRSQLLKKEKRQNATDFVKKLRSTVKSILNSHPKVINMEQMARVGQELGMQVDEEIPGCHNGISHAAEIVEEIVDVPRYKKKTLKLQGDLWKNVAKVEKELCRLKRQADTPTEDYKSQLREKRMDLLVQQNKCDLTDGITKFINGIQNLHKEEKHYFLKWMKFHLDCTARKNLSRLREEYKEKNSIAGIDPRQLAQLDELISTSSLGVEHFMRELGQFYEAECAMVKEGRITKKERQFIHLPRTVADLMLEGFPMELIDGDASNIPLSWITDVLTELHKKLRGQSKMMVITVLGVQSTGKSTLLNTMFGLQFAVSSGRCTRGAFMTLLRVTGDLQAQTGCDFILVIDTEGLKAPELAKLEDSYEHDNELATLVIGLSDITIVNLAMENATEMKDILQIVVHAFLRMEDTGHRPNCQFVHQNVSDVSAHDQNMRDRKRLLEQLNDMTKAAAKMEKQGQEVAFSDIMDYDPEKHNWYIPGLWHGVPPMAPVNMGYSEAIFKFKRYLFELMSNSPENKKRKDIPEFIEWVKSLWNAVKHENFIFSFRNSLVVEAYNQLSVEYSKWEWDFRKEMHLWVSKAEANLQNHSLKEIETGVLDKLKLEAQQKLYNGRQKMLKCIESYFESGRDNLHLVEKYREDFIRSAKLLHDQLESYSLNKCQDTILIRRGQSKVENLQAEYSKTIEGKVNKLLKKCKERKCQLNSEELEQEFEKMWKESLSELPQNSLPQRNIHLDVDCQLRKDLIPQGSFVNQVFQDLSSTSVTHRTPFKMDNKYLDKSWIEKVIENVKEKVNAFFTNSYKREAEKLAIRNSYKREAEKLANSLIEVCRSYVEKKVSTKGDYDETYCRELLKIMNDSLQGEDFQKFNFTPHFVVELKYYIMQGAADAFQKMHDEFLKANDPHLHLENLKPRYFSIFKDLYYEKDACQKRAKDFSDQCLRRALEDHLNKRLGIEIVDDFLSSGQSFQYGSRSFFQFTVQKSLLEKGKFEDYVTYINNYEHFVTNWIQTNLLEHYEQRGKLADLERRILSAVIKKTKEALENHVDQTLAEFLEHFRHEMREELVISKESLDLVLFNNDAKTGPFSEEVQACISEVNENFLSKQSQMSVETVLSSISFKPQEEIFKRVFGCGKQCPFCMVPCEAGGGNHREHFASVHRPQGLGRYRYIYTGKLVYSLCSSDVCSNCSFRNADTSWKFHPYKEYRNYYPDWLIQPDPSISASDYWKFVFKEFNQQFAQEYSAKCADLPDDWKRITKEQALRSIQEVYNMK